MLFTTNFFWIPAGFGFFIGFVFALIVSHLRHEAELRRMDHEAKIEARNRMWLEALNHMRGGVA